MISVTLDKEMVKRFKGRCLFPDDFVTGNSFFLDEDKEWLDSYDDEFTEWLKVHRPELFL